MCHKDFVEKYNSGEITVNVDNDKAGYMYAQSDMSKELRKKQALLRTLTFGGIILGFALFFFVQWWIAFSVLIISFFQFPKLQTIAGEDVLQASLDNPNVYQVAINNQVLTISNKMNHKDFVEKYNSGVITVSINKDKTNYIELELATREFILGKLALGGVILGSVLFFYVQWWIALSILLIAWSIFPMLEKTARDNILQATLLNQDVYQVAIDNQVLIISNKMTKEEISDVQTKGVKLLESIEEEMKDKKAGYEIPFKTFEGNYLHYHEFFKTLSNFRYYNDTCMCILNTKEMTIALAIGKLESRNLLYISAEKLKINT